MWHIENKVDIIKGYNTIIEALTDTTDLDVESEKLQGEIEVVTELMRKCVGENANSALDQGDYQQRYNELLKRYETDKGKLESINEERQERKVKRENIYSFMRMLKKSNSLLTEFDEKLWCATVETVTVQTEQELIFKFKDGREMSWKING